MDTMVPLCKEVCHIAKLTMTQYCRGGAGIHVMMTRGHDMMHDAILILQRAYAVILGVLNIIQKLYE